jgi:hypothetical protein
MRRRGLLMLATVGFASLVTVLGSGLVPASASTVSQGPRLAVKPVKPVEIALTPAGDSAKPRANPGCVLSYFPGDGAFVSRQHGIREVRINAEIRCRRVSTGLMVQVTLWKTGLFYPYRQAGPTTVTRSVGSSLANEATWRQCANFRNSTFYGTAYASVFFNGVRYSASGQSRNVTLACGT